jgi:hypothetical protein
MEALLKALAEALGPYLNIPTGGAVDTGDLSPQHIEAVQTAVGEFITAGGIESEIESAVRDEVESAISNNDLISQDDIQTMIEDNAETGVSADDLIGTIRDELSALL